MTNYYKIMSGFKSMHADECYAQGFIGVDFDIRGDLTIYIEKDYSDFSKHFIPLFLSLNPTKNRISAGLACGASWGIVAGFQINDIVLSPNGRGQFMVGKVTSNYYFVSEGVLPHRRKVEWLSENIIRANLSDELRSATKYSGTISQITAYAEEINSLIGIRNTSMSGYALDVLEPAQFSLEKYLEEFLITNWGQTDLGKNYTIFEEDGEIVGQQYPSDTGPIDILAISKDKKTLLVVELKRGRASDSVVGQVQRYMGFVKAQLAEPYQVVKGTIIALQDDLRIRRALSVAPNIDFYTYEVNFKLNRQ